MLYKRNFHVQLPVYVQRDVQYSCKVQDGSTLSSEKVVNVYVVNKIEVGTCPRHVYLNQSWPETAPHYGTVQPCPEGYAGTVYRGCILRDGKNPSWDTPDFSQCTHNKLVRLQKLVSESVSAATCGLNGV